MPRKISSKFQQHHFSQQELVIILYNKNQYSVLFITVINMHTYGLIN
jgi:hypothetical protein